MIISKDILDSECADQENPGGFTLNSEGDLGGICRQSEERLQVLVGNIFACKESMISPQSKTSLTRSRINKLLMSHVRIPSIEVVWVGYFSIRNPLRITII